jgi:hypothetical protein
MATHGVKILRERGLDAYRLKESPAVHSQEAWFHAGSIRGALDEYS